MTSKEIEQKILALKRPGIDAKYLIEAELDDLVALIQQAKIEELEDMKMYDWALDNDEDPNDAVHNQCNARISELKGETK